MDAPQLGMVWNPSKGLDRSDLEAALRQAAGATPPQVTWFETTEDDPGQGATDRALAAGVEVVVAAGGDGTVRAVAEQLAGSGATVDLGVVPLGTGNLLARNLAIPLADPAAALTRVLEDRPHPLDVGWIEIDSEDGQDRQRHAFVVMAGFGIDAHMITETDDDLKDRVGWLAYVESLGRALTASEVIDLGLVINDQPRVRDRAHTLLVGNCGTLQAGVSLLPDADPSDGELDLLVLRADGVASWLDTARSVVWDHGVRRLLGKDADGDGDQVTQSRLTTLEVELEHPRTIEADGDDLGEATRVRIRVQPSAVRVR